jgi:hypothetical protein
MIEIKSMALVKAINEGKGLTALREIKMDENDPQARPIYVFEENKYIMPIISDWLKNNKDDRSMDESWLEITPQDFYAPESGNCVITRNLYILRNIIAAGYLKNLCEVFKEPKGNGMRMAFKFISNAEIAEIKAKGDAQSKAYYQNKMKQGEIK